jgi:hypothetical protein
MLSAGTAASYYRAARQGEPGLQCLGRIRNYWVRGHQQVVSFIAIMARTRWECHRPDKRPATSRSDFVRPSKR